MQLTAITQKVQGGYIGWLEEFPGVNTQGATLSELYENLRDAFAMVIEANKAQAQSLAASKECLRVAIEVPFPA